jgi:hypothetical protein
MGCNFGLQGIRKFPVFFPVAREFGDALSPIFQWRPCYTFAAFGGD